MTVIAKLSGEQHATILAALRFWQEKGMGDPANRSDMLHDIATNGDTVISLDDAGIDELCEGINGGALVMDAAEASSTIDEAVAQLDAMTAKLSGFTVWVMDESREGTCHIQHYGFETQAMAELAAIETVSGDWEVSPDRLEVVGVAAGNVSILEWND